MSRTLKTLAVAFVFANIATAQTVWAQSLDEGQAISGSALANLTPMAKADLSKFAGGTAIDTLSLATNTSTVTGNSIGDVGASGAIGNNSLSGTSGLTTFIANSGNQVVISQSTVVNVYLH